jgi:cytochrome c5
MKHDALSAMLLVMAVALTLTLIALPGADDKPMSPDARLAQAPPQSETATAEATADTAAAPQAAVPDAPPAAVSPKTTTATPDKSAEPITTKTETVAAAAQPETATPGPQDTPAGDTAGETQPAQPETASAEAATSEEPQRTTDPGSAAVEQDVTSLPSIPEEQTAAQTAQQDDSSKPIEVATAEPAPSAQTTQPASAGAALYSQHCAQCHDGSQAPRLGDQQEWVNRFARGMDTLQRFVTEDEAHQPAAGELTAEQISDTLSYMMAQTFWPQNR